MDESTQDKPDSTPPPDDRPPIKPVMGQPPPQYTPFEKFLKKTAKFLRQSRS